MLFKCRFHSLPIFHFRRHLSFPPIPYSIVTQHFSNAACQPHHQWSQSNDTTLSLSRLRASVPVPDPTLFRDPDTGHWFYSNALKVSAKKGFLPEGKQIHAHLIKLGSYKVLSLQNQILSVYLKCKQIEDAEELFEEMHERNVVSWNILIRGIVDCGSNKDSNPHLGFSYFKRMMTTVVPDDITFRSLIGACIQLDDIDMGAQLHSFTLKLGYDIDCFVGSALVDLYGKCGVIEDARRVFSCVSYRDLVMWNVMISCYALNCLPEEACSTFNLMRLERINGDEYTFSSLLSSCGTFKYYDFGKQVHSLIIQQSFDSDVLVSSALVNMYAKNENITDAHRIFDEMTIRNVVSWNSIIVGCTMSGGRNEVMKLLKDMLREEYFPDELTLTSTLSSCGYAAAITETMQAHACTVKFGFQEFLSVANSLISAYSKCGSISCAYKCFSLIAEPTIITWTVLINAYGFHGLAKEAIEMFEMMLSCGIIPDRISFLGILSACAHCGLVSMGLQYFKLMTDVYHIVPDPQHYACIIDLLGRCGLIDEAFIFLRSMPIEAESNTLGAFIGSCKVHANIGLAKWAAEKLFLIEPKKVVNYSVMSNIYASEGHWYDVERVRNMMGDKCSSKVAGCSWIEIADQVHSFVSGDRSHPKASEVYAALKILYRPMKEESI